MTLENKKGECLHDLVRNLGECVIGNIQVRNTSTREHPMTWRVDTPEGSFTISKILRENHSGDPVEWDPDDPVESWSYTCMSQTCKDYPKLQINRAIDIVENVSNK